MGRGTNKNLICPYFCCNVTAIKISERERKREREGGRERKGGVAHYEKSLSSSQFFCEFKTALKHKVYFKRSIENIVVYIVAKRKKTRIRL